MANPMLPHNVDQHGIRVNKREPTYETKRLS